MEKTLKLIQSLSSTAEKVEAMDFTVTVAKDDFRKVAEKLKADGWDYLINLTAVDNQENIEVVYHLSKSSDMEKLLVLKTKTEDMQNPIVETVCDLWESASLYEREAYDFFGIRFLNNPDMRRLFLRPDWVGYPFRKDYDNTPNEKFSTSVHDVVSMENVPSITLNRYGEIEEKNVNLFDNDEYIVNFGPQHPSTHGVLHLRISLDGENVKKIDPHFGYIHRGIEKMMESMTYPQMLFLTERLDYLCGSINRHALCMCVEKAMNIEVPKRAVYIRTIFDELNRIASHLLGWACMCNDMGSITSFIYGFRDREKIMDIFQETCGGRLMVNYYVIGGVAQDLHPNTVNRIKEFIPYLREMIKEYHTLFTGNPIARDRMTNCGFLSKDQAVALGMSGPNGRASGWHCDVRKVAPYAAYGEVSFEEVLHKGGDTIDRYMIRLEEIEQSLRIIEQLIDKLPEGDFKAKVPAIVKVPAGEYYQRVENARGDFGVYIKSTGEKSPYRIKFRSPSMVAVSGLDPICKGTKVADLIMIGGSLDYVIPCIDR